MVNSVLELYGPKRILTSVATVGILLVFYGAWNGYVDDGVPVEVTAVSQGEIFQSITVPGRVVSKLRVNMTPAIAGRITNIYVEEGDHVESGDLLARLDDREAKSYLTRAKANLEGAKEDVVLAERSQKRLKQAFDKGAVARQLVEDAQVELRSARARESIASEEVRTAKLSLENPRVVAPFSGTVTARFIEVGQWVVPSETLFTLVDESQREIEVRVDAADSGGIAVGQTVNISSDAFPGLNWSESVTRLAAATNSVGNANTVSVYISLGSSAPSLRFGQQVDADIRTAWNPNALKIPYSAIINKKGASYVIVIDEGRAKYVQVETGIEDFSHVEILQGVNIGQSVVLANGQNIDNGQKVFLAANSR
jgi:RND family efflux transporter MFP subunit